MSSILVAKLTRHGSPFWLFSPVPYSIERSLHGHCTGDWIWSPTGYAHFVLVLLSVSPSVDCPDQPGATDWRQAGQLTTLLLSVKFLDGGAFPGKRGEGNGEGDTLTRRLSVRQILNHFPYREPWDILKILWNRCTRNINFQAVKIKLFV